MTDIDSSAQVLAARRMYDARASKYNDSWHPKFAQEIVELLDLQPGERVLDLACGTGLVTFAAASKVGPTGSVIAVDVSHGMLAEAKARLEREKHRFSNVKFMNHDIKHLASLKEVGKGEFDAITCASAIVLLEDPGAASKSWAKYLKPMGRLMVDIPNPRTILSSTVFERTHLRLGLPPASYREWIKSENSFRELLMDSGFDLERSKIVFMEQVGYGTRYRDVNDADTVFEENIEEAHCEKLRVEGVRAKAKDVFREEWAKMANKNGKLEEVDGVWVAVTRKSQSSTDAPGRIASGSCACGSVKWSTTSPPTSLNFCYCVTCRKISGSPFIAFMDFTRNAVMLSSENTAEDASKSSSLKIMSISRNAERGFCSECGSTILMKYHADPGYIGLTVGSLDEEKSQSGFLEGVKKKHIYVKDVPSWYKIPEDGLERQETMNGAAKLLVYE